MSMTITQGAQLLNALTGVSQRSMEASLTQAQVDGLQKWCSRNLLPENLFFMADIGAWASDGGANVDDIFTPAVLATYIDGNVPDPLDVYQAATLNSAGWTHA